MGIMTDQEFVTCVNRAVKRFRNGPASQIEQAVGALALGRQTGWKVLFLIHSQETIRNYEKLLDIEFREVLRPEGPKAKQSVAWQAFQGMNNFWDVVSGKVRGIKSALFD
jgi:hypothetical protein